MYKTGVVFSMPGQRDAGDAECEGSSLDTPYGEYEACDVCNEQFRETELWRIGDDSRFRDAAFESHTCCDAWSCFQAWAWAFTLMLDLDQVQVLQETGRMMQWYEYLHSKGKKDEEYDPESAADMYDKFVFSQGRDYIQAEDRVRKRAEAEAEECAEARKKRRTGSQERNRDND